MIDDKDISVIKIFIDWFNSSPYGFFMFITIILIYLWRDSIKCIPNLVSNIGLNYTIKSKIKNYTLKDCKEHPLFTCIDFWLETGLHAICYNNSYVLLYNLSEENKEPNDYLQAKEEMAKEVIKIKNKTVGNAFKKFLELPNLDNYTPTQALIAIKDIFEKLAVLQQKEYIDSDLPKIFISKFLAYDKSSLNYFMKSLEQYFNEELFIEINISTRIYLALNAITSYMSALNNTMFATIISINGDLNGVTWHGKTVYSCLGNYASHEQEAQENTQSI